MPDMGFDPTTSNLNETSVSVKLQVGSVCHCAFVMYIKLGNFRKVIKYRGISSTNLDSNLLLPLCDERAAVCVVSSEVSRLSTVLLQPACRPLTSCSWLALACPREPP